MVKIQAITHKGQKNILRLPIGQNEFSRAREFQRALNAVKLEKIFAKPFIGCLTGHADGVTVVRRCPSIVNQVISGAQDGQIKIWDIANRKCLVSSVNHQFSVKGVCFSGDGHHFVSSSQQSIYLYNFLRAFHEEKDVNSATKYLSKSLVGNVDHSPNKPEFATSGQIVQVWSYQRTKPIHRLEWNSDTILHLKYNPADPNILCGTAADRSIILYDIRAETPIQKIYLPNKSSCISFNPIEPINLVVGNDDSNCYSFDIRKMQKPRTIHKDHIAAVTDIDYSPTGAQFTTASYDRTVRIFGRQEGTSKQVYHGKRMQIVNCVTYSVDSHYIFSGSEDMNIRIWKSHASMPVGTINQRQQRAFNYKEALIKKYQHNPKIKRIARHHHLPKYILNAKKMKFQQNTSAYRKKINKQANTGVVEAHKGQKEKIVQKIQIQNEQRQETQKKYKKNR